VTAGRVRIFGDLLGRGTLVRRLAAIAMVMAALVATTACTGPAEPGTVPTTAPTTAATTEGPPCADPALAGTGVSFTNNVGATLRGYLVGDGEAGIVLANQFEMKACSWSPYAKSLAERGYRVLAFDFSSDALSGPVPGATNDGDVVAAAEFLRRQGTERVVLLGASRGGTAVLVAATQIEPAVAGVISLSGPSSFRGMDALTAVASLTVPVLYIVSDRDTPCNTDAQALFDATPPALGKLVVLEGVGHGVQYPLNVATTSERAMLNVDEFLAAHAPVARPA
jgi:dienelactone hydrolase